ncbi:phytoene/squalene synthase family protein [Sphingomonas sp. HDW15A]|uniref:phytoene/squalene synthase family protein n=1 Tax=Sphingomonas sp. HDW15A TaxID=2714942 RepID=UPI0014098BFF|nr:phytoene/squalene synthase family protein [Sphingomonas sp. HDW15A]QIK95166.1 phytoene/squalene synthase family protein [Sphingomonas sp. HDW15A]
MSDAPDRAALVIAAQEIIARGSKSFRSASALFDERTRERAWLLYAWCRACDDLIDGQVLGHHMTAPANPKTAYRKIVSLTDRALAGETTGVAPFDAFGIVARECEIPPRAAHDHLDGFALDAKGWRPDTTDDLLRYCFHVAGAVGVMMALVMGVDPEDKDTLDRASDLGIAFQLANIARDIVADAREGRVYLPQEWLADAELDEKALADPANGDGIASLAARLVDLSRAYRASARVGARRLPLRSRLAVLAASNVYGAIGEKVVSRGSSAWQSRTIVTDSEKLEEFALALAQAVWPAPNAKREGLWTRPA